MNVSGDKGLRKWAMKKYMKMKTKKINKSRVVPKNMTQKDQNILRNKTLIQAEL